MLKVRRASSALLCGSARRAHHSQRQGLFSFSRVAPQGFSSISQFAPHGFFFHDVLSRDSPCYGLVLRDSPYLHSLLLRYSPSRYGLLLRGRPHVLQLSCSSYIPAHLPCGVGLGGRVLGLQVFATTRIRKASIVQFGGFLDKGRSIVWMPCYCHTAACVGVCMTTCGTSFQIVCDMYVMLHMYIHVYITHAHQPCCIWNVIEMCVMCIVMLHADMHMCIAYAHYMCSLHVLHTECDHKVCDV